MTEHSDRPHITPISDQERLERLRLIRSENVGPITYRQLLLRYGNAKEALEALPSLAKRGGRAKRLRLATLAQAEAELEKLTLAGGRLISFGEPDYPNPLMQVDDAPPILSVFGYAALMLKPCIAIVGARNASTNGKALTQKFARALGDAGYIVTSGLARGIDGAAHAAALEKGTVAVVAGGVDQIYPPEHEKLYRALAERGAIVSEQPLGTVAQARHFPRRNRIISGLSRAVLVIEAKLESGSLITARLAAEQGRDVYALPGSPVDPRARGGNDLIRKGAALIETPGELISYLRELPETDVRSPPATRYASGPAGDQDDAQLSEARAALLNAIGPDAVLIDDLISDLGLAPNLVATALMDLELAGTLERRAGGRVAAVGDAGPFTADVQGDLF